MLSLYIYGMYFVFVFLTCFLGFLLIQQLSSLPICWFFFSSQLAWPRADDIVGLSCLFVTKIVTAPSMPWACVFLALFQINLSSRYHVFLPQRELGTLDLMGLGAAWRQSHPNTLIIFPTRLSWVNTSQFLYLWSIFRVRECKASLSVIRKVLKLCYMTSVSSWAC
jgi:hypothetical protein